MTLSPALRKMVSNAAEKYSPRGIIPLEPVDVHPRMLIIGEIACMISDAVSGPPIGALELAEQIVEAMEKSEYCC
jgi:hypothetical protein